MFRDHILSLWHPTSRAALNLRDVLLPCDRWGAASFLAHRGDDETFFHAVAQSAGGSGGMPSVAAATAAARRAGGGRHRSSSWLLYMGHGDGHHAHIPKFELWQMAWRRSCEVEAQRSHLSEPQRSSRPLTQGGVAEPIATVSSKGPPPSRCDGVGRAHLSMAAASSVEMDQASGKAEPVEDLPVAMLMGCSSIGVAVSSSPTCRPSLPLPYAWLAAGAPAVVGCLWDVTDGDLDRVTAHLLRTSLEAIRCRHTASSSSQDVDGIAASLPAARGVAKLRWLTGAAVVCYAHAFQGT